MSARGRGPDSTLVHMSPREVEGLQKLAVAHGTTLTINPDTGLPEAFSLKDLLPTLAGAAINYFAPGFGTAIGEVVGLGSAAGTGLAVGAATAALTGDLGKGLSAGLGAYGGAGITDSLAGMGAAQLGSQAVEEGVGQKLSDQALQESVANRMASSTMADKVGAGLSYAGSNPMSALKTSGKYLAAAAAPIFAGEVGNTVQTTTPKQSTGYIRPHTYDPYSQTYTRETPYAAAKGGLTGLAKGGSVGYADGGTTYTPEQITSAINTSRQQGFTDADVATGLGRFITDPAAVQAAMAANPYGAASITNKDIYEPFGGASQYSNPLVNGFGAAAPTTQAAQSYTPEQITNAINTSRQQGFSDVDVATGLGRYLPNQQAVQSALTANPKLAPYNPATQSTAEYWATQPGWTSETGGKTGIAGLNQNIANYAGNLTPTTVKSLGLSDASSVEARIRSDMAKTGASESDVQRATGKTVAQLAAGAFPQPIQTSINTVAPGAGGATGAGQVGGGTTVNPNGTITTSPVIPGIPVGGFTGMEQVKDTYTKGGGSLGYTPYTPKTIAELNTKYTNTGDSKAMYDYLMGKGPYPTSTGAADVAGQKREPFKPYTEVMGGPVNPNKQYTWNKTSGKYDTNPDYVRQQTITDPTTKEKSVINYMTLNQAKAVLDKTPLEGNALADWAILNNVHPSTLAEATGKTYAQINALLAKAKADKAFGKKEGGLMSLASGGITRFSDGGQAKEYIDSSGSKYYWDFANGIYRPETAVKDGITYKWNPITNKYETSSSNGTGIASLVNSEPPAGGENPPNTTPNWNATATIGKGLSDLGLTTFGDYVSQLARDGRTTQQIDPTDIQDSSRDDTRGPMRGKSVNADTDIGPEVSSLPSITGPDALASITSDVAARAAAAGMTTAEFAEKGLAEVSAQAQADRNGRPGGEGLGGAYSGGGGDPALNAKGGYIGHYAQGGLGSLGGYSDGGRLLRGPGDGVSDSIPASIGNRQPARLADGEFVVPARIVSELGNGSTEAGARALYKMMDRIQANRRKTTGKNSVAVDSKAHKYLPA